jgi:ribosomal protein S18 acetylase RimI-like enzyme
MYTIQRQTGTQHGRILADLVSLLQNVVHNGASVGFLPPLETAVAEEYWRKTISEVLTGERVLLTAHEDDHVVGCIQLALATKQNAMHRAEVQKLIVHSGFRNRGIATALLDEAEKIAREMGRTLLFLDTERGSAAEKLYPKSGYIRVGEIPQYARRTDQSLVATVLFYKLLAD